MTKKQEALLKKFLTEQQVEEMKGQRFRDISALINMILVTQNYSLKDKIEKPSGDVQNKALELEKLINKNKSHYTSILDEHCSFTHAYLIKGTQTILYRFEQSWFKGMSATPSKRWFFVMEDGSKFSTTEYSILYDANIKNIEQLLEALYTQE